ncbi:MAG: glycosyltransferase family 2 protein [Verrucomicrobiota bacterium]
MSSPLVSICIPCHNATPYVGAALESALAQTWPNLEIIVVNDGSTDGSGEVIAEFESRGVKVIHKHCGSAAKARNCALREAAGDYIKFFDADDLLSPEMVEKQMLRLNGRNDAIASSEWGRFYDELSSFQPNPQSVWRDMEATEWLVEAWADARPMMQPGMFLIPREILSKAGSWDEGLTLIDDFEFYARLLCHANQVLFTPGAILYYRSGIAGSLSAQKSPEAIESAYHSLLKGTGHLLELRNDLATRRSCANVLQDFVYSYYPSRADLIFLMKCRVRELGGSELEPDGPPRYHLLRRWVGWRLAKRIQRLAGR